MNSQVNADKANEPTRQEPRYVAPNVDILETKEEYLLEADMPGVGKDGIQLKLDGNELTILGNRPHASEKAKNHTHILHHESVPANFRRAFVLDPEIDTARITAEIDQGLLTVRLPKTEAVKPRLIPVTD